MITQAFSKMPSSTHRQLTEHNETKKLAREVLRRVDHFIKIKDLEKALEEIRHVKEIDPRNVYALAFEERIQALMADQTKSKQQKETVDAKDAFQTKNPLENLKSFSKNTSNSISQDLQQKPKVLVIDDDNNLLMVLSMVIESGGFDVVSKSTSDEAYALLKTYHPDIILCDVNLETSTMGGFAFFEKIQEIEHVKNIPFIFLSGLSYDLLFRTAKELGADDYLTKPINGQNLLVTLRGKLKRYDKMKKNLSSNVSNSTVAASAR